MSDNKKVKEILDQLSQKYGRDVILRELITTQFKPGYHWSSLKTLTERITALISVSVDIATEDMATLRALLREAELFLYTHLPTGQYFFVLYSELWIN